MFCKWLMVPDLVEIILGFCAEISWGALGERKILNLAFQCVCLAWITVTW